MSATTLVTAAGPTLADGLAELLPIAHALTDATDCGVVVERDQLGQLTDAYPDSDVPPGVIQTDQAEPIDPWASVTKLTGTIAGPVKAGTVIGHVSDGVDARARRELVELLAHVTSADIVATAADVQLVPSCASW